MERMERSVRQSRASSGEWRLSHTAPGLENKLVLFNGAVHGKIGQISIFSFPVDTIKTSEYVGVLSCNYIRTT